MLASIRIERVQLRQDADQKQVRKYHQSGRNSRTAFKMLSETFVTSIRALQKSVNTAVAKDVGIHAQTLHPIHSIDNAFKKSSTEPNCLAINSSHIFAAQSGKAVVHVYSRERSNQEALISFRERIHCLSLAGEGVLVLGTAEGRVILWEVRILWLNVSGAC